MSSPQTCRYCSRVFVEKQSERDYRDIHEGLCKQNPKNLLPIYLQELLEETVLMHAKALAKVNAEILREYSESVIEMLVASGCYSSGADPSRLEDRRLGIFYMMNGLDRSAEDRDGCWKDSPSYTAGDLRERLRTIEQKLRGC